MLNTERQEIKFFKRNQRAIGKLIKQPELVAELMDYRLDGRSEFMPTPALDQALNEIFTVYYGYAKGLAAQRIPILGAEEIWGDIESAQALSLWEMIVKRFDWGRYTETEHAAAALTTYVQKSTGANLAKGIISHWPQGMRASRNRHRHIERPVEDVIIATEEAGDISRVFTEWSLHTSPLNLSALRQELTSNLTREELAINAGVTPRAINKRVNTAKRELYRELELAELVATYDFLEEPLLLGTQKAIGILEYKRSLLIRQWKRLEIALTKKPQLAKVLKIFYGIGETTGCYEIATTAKITGLSESNIRHFLSEGNQLIINGYISDRIQQYVRDFQTYQFWLKHSDLVGLEPELVEALIAYFGARQSQAEIGEQFGVSETSVGRYVDRALGLITIAMNEFFA